MNLEIAERKRALRRQIRDVQDRVSADERARASAELCRQIQLQPIWQESRHVLLFSPLPDEPDIRPLLEAARRAGQRVALPRFDAGRSDYEARWIESANALVRGHFGILEPGAGAPVAELNRLDFILVPGVSFDCSGRRLGRGKGYFDRLLAQVRGHKCGVAFEWQVVAEVPVEPHDIGVNSLLTPSRWFRCAE